MLFLDLPPLFREGLKIIVHFHGYEQGYRNRKIKGYGP